ncbi:MAG: alanine--tRNA ligase [Planctomycetota bacterium]
MKTDELREKYLAYFESQGHSRQPSDVLVPTWDPSVLFTPAGMNQFKDHFLGKVKLDFTRATTCQKCLRTGDIDNVGRTAFHHTFFEMLGNFSFGDYFKEEAIRWAWEFLTAEKWLGIEKERLNVTVYKDDQEAAGIWHERIGLPTSRIAYMDEDENFWPASAPSQGPDGVCGPCSEIYYQLDDGKDVEIWNLVFTQFNRIGDPPDNLRPLPSKNIDTGMGLERCASVLQNVPTNFHIDILLPIVQAAAETCGVQYEYDSDNGRRLRRITDHVRACVFSVHEHILPGPKKARYIVKRLLRRAVLDGHQLGLREPFLFELVPAVADAMKTPYPELQETIERVQNVIRTEEESFFATIDNGLGRIDRVFETMTEEDAVMVDGGEVAQLYQTYGFPPELCETLASARNFTIDWDGFKEAMQRHQADDDPTLGGQLFKTGPIENAKKALGRTEFLGYENENSQATLKVIVIEDDEGERAVTELSADKAGEAEIRLILDCSPFYGEGGGQVGDSGTIRAEGLEFVVTDTQRDADLLIHFGRLKQGKLSEGLTVNAVVDPSRRAGIMRAHSATHILHFALQSILGKHAQQQGSKVDEDWLRFDFTNQQSLSDQEIEQIETIVDEKVDLAAPISWNTVPLADARQAGAMMLFGEKYPDPVRMVSMGEFSKELCGGTHLTNTSQVQQFEVVVEEGVSAGTRRVVAFTGEKAREHREKVGETLASASEALHCAPGELASSVEQLTVSVRGLKKQLSGAGKGNAPQPGKIECVATESYSQQRALLKEAARTLNVSTADVTARIKALLEEKTKLETEVSQSASSNDISVDDLLSSSTKIGEASVIICETPGANPNMMRQWIDQARQKSDTPTAILFACVMGGEKVLLVAGVSRDLVERSVSAGKWIAEVAPVVGGGGGGKPDLAQAGGKDPTKLQDALAKALETITAMLQ